MADPIQSTKPKNFTPIEPPPPEPAKKSAQSKPAAVDLSYVPSAPPTKPPPSASYPGGMSVDVSSWPMPVLERNVLAIRAHLARDPKGVSQAERDQLGAMEKEIAKRDAAVPKVGAEPPKTGVMLCKRPAELNPVIDRLGFQHHWLKTSKHEVGMGVVNGGVPGQAGGNNGYVGSPTAWNDHSGQSEGVDANCTPLPDVDEDCIDEATKPVTKTGPWIPVVNDCHGVTAAVIEKCKAPGADPAAMAANQEADAGAP